MQTMGTPARSHHLKEFCHVRTLRRCQYFFVLATINEAGPPAISLHHKFINASGINESCTKILIVGFRH